MFFKYKKYQKEKTAKENKKPNTKKEEKSKSKSKEKNTKKEKEEKKGKKDKSEKEDKKDKNKIKKPLGPYILFGKEERPKIVAAHPELKNKEIMAALGEAWNKLSDSEKKKYQDQAAKDKERYEKE